MSSPNALSTWTDDPRGRDLMQRTRMRLTVFHLLLVVAVAAILMQVATGPLKSRAAERFERCRQLAESHASLAAEYRQNSGGDAGMLRISRWQEHMRNQFERAARQPEIPLPPSRPFPPQSWIAPAEEDSAKRSSIEEIAVPDPSPSEPVTAVMTIQPNRASVGETVEVLVHIRIASAHFIHAKDDAGGPFVPVAVNTTLPTGVEPIGDWQVPTPEKGRGNSLVYRNSVVLRRSLKVVSSSAPSNSDGDRRAPVPGMHG